MYGRVIVSAMERVSLSPGSVLVLCYLAETLYSLHRVLNIYQANATKCINVVGEKAWFGLASHPGDIFLNLQ